MTGSPLERRRTKLCVSAFVGGSFRRRGGGAVLLVSLTILVAGCMHVPPILQPSPSAPMAISVDRRGELMVTVCQEYDGFALLGEHRRWAEDRSWQRFWDVDAVFEIPAGVILQSGYELVPGEPLPRTAEIHPGDEVAVVVSGGYRDSLGLLIQIPDGGVKPGEWLRDNGELSRVPCEQGPNPSENRGS